jgi:hypothetical protein
VACTLALRETGKVERERFYKLHTDGKRLIHGWLGKGLGRDTEDTYEAFIYLWIGFNAWAACVTNEDADRRMVKALALDRDLNEEFGTLLEENSRVSEAARAFHGLWPIFRVQELRGLGVPYFHLAGTRVDVAATYLRAGAEDFEPECWADHASSADGVPLDWAHTAKAIYRVRCNLFHGEKARTSEDDQQVVRAAFDVLAAFVQEGQLAT